MATCGSSHRPGSGRRFRSRASAKSTRPRRKSAWRWRIPDADRNRKGFNPIDLPGSRAQLHGARARPRANRSASASISTRPSPRSGWARWDSTSSCSRDCCSASHTSSARTTACSSASPAARAKLPMLARGKRLEVAPETELYHLTIEAVQGGELRIARRPRQSQQRLVRRARAGARRRHDQCHRVAGHAARQGGLDAHAGDPGVAGGLSPRAAQAGHHRAGSARYAARPT